MLCVCGDGGGAGGAWLCSSAVAVGVRTWLVGSWAPDPGNKHRSRLESPSVVASAVGTCRRRRKGGGWEGGRPAPCGQRQDACSPSLDALRCSPVSQLVHVAVGGNSDDVVRCRPSVSHARLDVFRDDFEMEEEALAVRGLLEPCRFLGKFYWPCGPLDARGLTHPSSHDVLLKKLRNQPMYPVDLTLQPSNKYNNPPNELVRLGDIRWTQGEIGQEWGDTVPCRSLWDTVKALRSEDPPEIFRSAQAKHGIPTMLVVCRNVVCMGKVCRDASHHIYTTSSRRLFVFKTVFGEEQMIPVHRKAWKTLFPSGNANILEDGCKIRIRCCRSAPSPICDPPPPFRRDRCALGRRGSPPTTAGGGHSRSLLHLSLQRRGRRPLPA